MLGPAQILHTTIYHGIHKVHKSLREKIILVFIGGAMISLGYLAYIRVVSSIAHEWPSIASLVGAAIFPIGLIVILLAGGELITGNMMAVAAAFIGKKVSFKDLVLNFLIVTCANIVGALFVAFVFGHFVGLTATGVFKEEVIAVAQAKIAVTPLQGFFSGIGCNWFVGLALWLCYGAKDATGKILATWFPVMTFVAIGFQHSVANAFVIPAAIFEGGATWTQFLGNFFPVYAGNIIGGAVFVSLFYFYAYKDDKFFQENKDIDTDY
jgi:formate/nitrite transporter